ncbi:MAG: hypothetical protein VX278_13840, partial [Myxococcota bacterium]|nr:hypothetical protein [Myxococcota bacterium]
MRFSLRGVEMQRHRHIVYWSPCADWWLDREGNLYFRGETFALLPHVPNCVTGYQGVCCYRWEDYLICFDRDGSLFEVEHAGAGLIHMSLDARFLAVVENAEAIAIYTVSSGICSFRYPIQETVAELRFVLGWKLFLRYDSGDFVLLQLEGLS